MTPTCAPTHVVLDRLSHPDLALRFECMPPTAPQPNGTPDGYIRHITSRSPAVPHQDEDQTRQSHGHIDRCKREEVHLCLALRPQEGPREGNLCVDSPMDGTALTKDLAAMEAQPSGVGKLPNLRAAAVDQLRRKIQEQGGLHVSVDCKAEQILATSEQEVDNVIIPLCAWLAGLVEAQSTSEAGRGGRVLVGIVGAAAAGKSVLAQLVCAASAILHGNDSWAQCVSMDGYSYFNSHLVAQPATDHLGRACTLKDIKGAPSTLDADAFLRDLLRLRSSSTSSQTILLPAYDRKLHDPVPDSIAISPDCRVVVVEGLHLLHNEGQWKDISTMFHRTVFLDIERSRCFDRVVGRKVGNGRSQECSEAHFLRVDGPIFDQLQKEKKRANVVLTVRPIEGEALRIVNIDARLKPGEQEGDARSPVKTSGTVPVVKVALPASPAPVL